MKYLLLLLIIMFSLAPWLAKAEAASPENSAYLANKESLAEVAGRTAVGAAAGCAFGGGALGVLAAAGSPGEIRGLAQAGCKYGAVLGGATILYENASHADELPSEELLDDGE